MKYPHTIHQPAYPKFGYVVKLKGEVKWARPLTYPTEGSAISAAMRTFDTKVKRTDFSKSEASQMILEIYSTQQELPVQILMDIPERLEAGLEVA